MRVQAEIKGLNELIRGYDNMARRGYKRAVRSGMRKSSSVMNKAAKKNEQAGETGQTKRSLGVKVKVYPSGIVIGIVQPRKGFIVYVPRVSKRTGQFLAARKHDPRRIAHLIEGGTKVRQAYTRSRANRGRMSARPFLEPAFIQNESKVIPIFAAEFDTELAREVPQT